MSAAFLNTTVVWSRPTLLCGSPIVILLITVTQLEVAETWEPVSSRE